MLNDPNVSRRHAELRRGPTGDWQIVDLGSTNGVKVNGRQVDASRLAPGDEVVLGTVRFIFDIEQLSAAAHGHRADRGRAEVRLPRRALPVPVLGLAQRPARAARAPAPRRPRRPAFTRSAPAGAPRRPTPGWSRSPAAGCRPASATTSSAASRSGAPARPTCGSRTASPPSIHARLYSRGASYYVEDMGSTNGTFLNGGAARRARPSSPTSTRSGSATPSSASSSRCPESADGCCGSPSRPSGPTPGASGPRTRTPTSPARRCSRSPTGWAAPRRARSPRGSRPSRSSPPSRGGESAEALPARDRRDAPTSASTSLAQHDSSRSGMGTTLTAALVEGDEVVDRPRRRQPRLPLPRRRAAPADLRPLAGRGAAPPGPAHRRAGRGPPAALDHHPGARPRGEVEVDTLTFSARPGDVFLLCSDGLTTMVKDDADRRDRSPSADDLDEAVDAARRRGQRGRRPRQHHRRRLPARGRRGGRGRRGRDADRPERRGGGLDRRAGPRRGRAARGAASDAAEPPRRSRWRTAAKVARGARWSSPAIGVGAVLGARQVYFLGIDEGGRVDALPRAALRPAARDQPLLRGLLGPGPGGLGPRRPPRLGHRPRAALATTTRSTCSTTSRRGRRPRRRRRAGRRAAATAAARAAAAAGTGDGGGRTAGAGGGGSASGGGNASRPQRGYEAAMSARNRELLALVPVAVLVTAGFAAVFIVKRTNEVSRRQPHLRRLLPRPLPRRAPVPALPPAVRRPVPVPALRAARRDRARRHLPDRRQARLRPGLGVRARARRSSA